MSHILKLWGPGRPGCVPPLDRSPQNWPSCRGRSHRPVPSTAKRGHAAQGLQEGTNLGSPGKWLLAARGMRTAGGAAGRGGAVGPEDLWPPGPEAQVASARNELSSLWVKAAPGEGSGSWLRRGARVRGRARRAARVPGSGHGPRVPPAPPPSPAHRGRTCGDALAGASTPRGPGGRKGSGARAPRPAAPEAARPPEDGRDGGAVAPTFLLLQRRTRLEVRGQQRQERGAARPGASHRAGLGARSGRSDGRGAGRGLGGRSGRGSRGAAGVSSEPGRRLRAAPAARTSGSRGRGRGRGEAGLEEEGPGGGAGGARGGGGDSGRSAARERAAEPSPGRTAPRCPAGRAGPRPLACCWRPDLPGATFAPGLPIPLRRPPSCRADVSRRGADRAFCPRPDAGPAGETTV